MPAAIQTRPETASPYLKVDGLSKSFGEAQVLDGISFSLQKGRCLGLLGASGCGKSTLLNIVAGLLRRIWGGSSWRAR
jgi:ABC-type multidrug transport system ATPase subunit